MDQASTATRRQKFRNLFAQRNDYRIFVGIPLAQPCAWDQILLLEMDTLVAANLRVYPVKEIRSWVVAYSDTEEIVDSENLFAPLPPGVNGILSQELPLPDFSTADLRRGRVLLRIQFGKSSTHFQNPDIPEI